MLRKVMILFSFNSYKMAHDTEYTREVERIAAHDNPHNHLNLVR